MGKGKYKAISIVGARPNFIKAAPISHALKTDGNFEEIIVHTGQHYDHTLSQSFFDELDIPTPKYNLGIGSGNQTWQLGEMIRELGEVIAKEKPDITIVFGDTNSTAAGAIAAAKLNVPLAHIEAGLREFNKNIPEEINKLLTDAVTDLYFCPTQTGVDNLKKNGITENVYLVGDVGIDLVQNNMEKILANDSIFKKLNINKNQYYFFTCHRASNTSSKYKLTQILGLAKSAGLPVIWPMHPRTQKAIDEFGLPLPSFFKNVTVLPPISFTDTQTLIKYARAVMTDSGGIVKEAYFHKTPALIMDEQIEWIETVQEGWNHIIGADKQKGLSLLKNLSLPDSHSNCLGNGDAAIKSVETIKFYLEEINLPNLS